MAFADPTVEFQSTPRFEIKQRLGMGGMGVVYEAFDRERNMSVALKTLRQTDPQALYRLKNEFRALQDIEHPNLISLGELVEEDGRWFFTMEYVDGIDFLSYVRQPAAPLPPGSPWLPLPEQELLPGASAGSWATPGPPEPLARRAGGSNEALLRATLRQLASGLVTLHAAGKIHRDIKPSNVLVSQLGRVVLMDFGLTTNAEPVEQSTGKHIVGTAEYMAPEQAASDAVDPAADWYSVGVMLYEALTGQVPFNGSPIKIFMCKQVQEPPTPSSLAADVPSDLEQLCIELLAIDPKARPNGRQILGRLGGELPSLGSLSTSARFSLQAPFVGRDREFELLTAAYQDTRRGEAVVVTVCGESGVGKSALLREFTAQLRTDDDLPQAPVVLAGRCYEREAVPFKAFDGVLDALSRHISRLPDEQAYALLPHNAAILPRIFPALGRVEVFARSTPLSSEVKDPLELRRLMFAALRELFALFAESNPLIVIIDDLQWADCDSLQMLSDLMRPPGAPAMLLLISSREPTIVNNELAAGGDTPPLIPGDVRQILLQPLSPDGAQQLARLLLQHARLEHVIDPAVIATEALGHPLFIDELVRHMALSGEQEGQFRLDEAIWHRVSQLEPTARQILELVVVGGAPLSQEGIRQATRLDPSTFRRQLSFLRVSHLVRTNGNRIDDLVEPYHDRISESVLKNLEPQTRAQHHARLALILESTGGRPELLLRHLEASGQTQRAAQYAEQAAQRAGEALAFDRAADLYRSALRLAQTEEQHQRTLRLRLAEALVNAGRSTDAAPIFIAAAEGAEPATRMDCQRQAAEQWLVSGFFEEGLTALQALLAEVGTELPATPRRALVILLWSRLKLALRGLGWKEKLESQIAREELTRLDVYKAVGQGLALLDNIRGADFQTRGLLLALKTGERVRVCRAMATESIFHASQGGRGLQRAAKLVAETQRIAQPSQNPYLIAWAITADGMTHYFGGQFAQAAELLDQCERIFRNQTVGSIWEVSNTRLFRMFSLRYQGRWALLRQLYNRYMLDAERRGDLYLLAAMGRHSCLLSLIDDDPQAARHNLERTYWKPPPGVFHLQHWYELEELGELAVYEQRAATTLEELRPRFRALEHSLLTRVQIVRVVSFWLRGRLALAAATGEAEPHALLKESAHFARQLQREKISYATIFGLLLRAGIAARLKKTEQSVGDLRQALQLSEQHQMLVHAAVCRRRIGELIGGEEGTGMIVAADTWMESENIRNPQHMTRTYLPWANNQ